MLYDRDQFSELIPLVDTFRNITDDENLTDEDNRYLFFNIN